MNVAQDNIHVTIMPLAQTLLDHMHVNVILDLAEMEGSAMVYKILSLYSFVIDFYLYDSPSSLVYSHGDSWCMRMHFAIQPCVFNFRI